MPNIVEALKLLPTQGILSTRAHPKKKKKKNIETKRNEGNEKWESKRRKICQVKRNRSQLKLEWQWKCEWKWGGGEKWRWKEASASSKS